MPATIRRAVEGLRVLGCGVGRSKFSALRTGEVTGAATKASWPLEL